MVYEMDEIDELANALLVEYNAWVKYAYADDMYWSYDYENLSEDEQERLNVAHNEGYRDYTAASLARQRIMPYADAVANWATTQAKWAYNEATDEDKPAVLGRFVAAKEVEAREIAKRAEIKGRIAVCEAKFYEYEFRTGMRRHSDCIPVRNSV